MNLLKVCCLSYILHNLYIDITLWRLTTVISELKDFIKKTEGNT